jgi:FkbM family methyltransferase
LSSTILHSLGPSCLPRPIRVVDVGAMAISSAPPAYKVLDDAKLCEVIGFEPNEKERLRLEEMDKEGHRYLSDVIGRGDTREFRICRMPSRSSLYEPNVRLCDLFNAFSEGSEVVERRSVATRRLDDVVDPPDADFLKLDVQGAELDVLVGGRQVASSAVVVETEVELVPQYVGQPLFPEVHSELVSRGFMFHTVLGYGTRAAKPVVIDGDPLRGVNQWLWADVVYVKDLTTLAGLAADKLLSMAFILDMSYGSFDLAYLALSHYDARARSNYSELYLNALG